MSRDELIHRIRDLSDDELAAVGPFLSADLDAIGDLQSLLHEAELGERSARTEPLVDDEDVVRSVMERLRRA